MTEVDMSRIVEFVSLNEVHFKKEEFTVLPIHLS